LLLDATAVQPISSGVDVSASTVSFTSDADLEIFIGGPAVDSGYRQFNVAGEVNLFVHHRQ
jgi:hypothetical protein